MNEAAGGVQSVQRALGLLKLLSLSEFGCRVSDLAREAGLPVSTTHRLLTTLELEGFASFDPSCFRWHVGRESYSVGATYAQRFNFVASALPHLKRLRDETRETVNLGILDGDELVTLTRVDSREIVRAISREGGRTPVFCSGMGKAILATWPDAHIAQLANRAGFRPLTRRSHRTLDVFMRDISQVRSLGFATDDEEHEIGTRCVAAAFRSANGDAIGAISVSAASSRFCHERMAEVGAVLSRVAATISLGGSAS